MIDKQKVAKLLKELERLKAVKESGALGGFIVDLISKIEVFLAEKEKLEAKFDATIERIKAETPNLDNFLKSVKGRQGDQGIKGDKGDKGDRGEQGKSIIGPQGIKGEKGEKGDIGLAGKDADEELIAAKASKLASETLKPLIPIIEQIEADLPKLGEKIRDSLELLENENRLKISAIDKLQETLDELKNKPTRIGGGGTSDMGVAMSLTRIIRTETPTGTINGINKVFTVSTMINVVLSFGINGMVISDNEYTFSGNTITFIDAIPADLSSTNFRIKFI